MTFSEILPNLKPIAKKMSLPTRTKEFIQALGSIALHIQQKKRRHANIEIKTIS